MSSDSSFFHKTQPRLTASVVRHYNLSGAGKFSGQFNGTVAVNRGALADAIVAAAAAERPGESASSGAGSVAFSYGQTVSTVDFERRVARFSRSSTAVAGDDVESVAYDLLVGADGVNSAVRGLLQEDGRAPAWYRCVQSVGSAVEYVRTFALLHLSPYHYSMYEHSSCRVGKLSHPHVWAMKCAF